MNETRTGLRLLLELLHELGIAAVFLEHHLDGHRTVEHLVTAHVYAAHAAPTQLALKQEIAGLAERARRRNQLFFAHRMILHPLKGQNTMLPTPRRFAPGTEPQ